jgi:hypothetical protein
MAFNAMPSAYAERLQQKYHEDEIAATLQKSHSVQLNYGEMGAKCASASPAI